MAKDRRRAHALWVAVLLVGKGCMPYEQTEMTTPRGTGGFSGDPFSACGQFGTGVGGSSGFGVSLSSAVPLQLGPTVTPTVPPPPVSGGTLRVLRDGRTAVAADPDRDQISVVDLGAAAVTATIPLMTGDQPGRIVEDGAGGVHVVLRGAGAVLDMNPVSGAIVGRRSVCAAPRGIAYDPKSGRLHVACAGGELVSLSAAGGAATRTVKLDRDLRDVIVDGDHLLVSRFRSAQILTVDANGAVMERLTPAPFRSGEAHFGGLFSPAVAWRMVEMPGGGAAMVHQRGLDDTVASQPGGYGSSSPCDSIVHTTVTVVKDRRTPAATPALAGMVLTTDMAVSPDGKRVALVATGNATNADTAGAEPTLPRVFVTDVESISDAKVGCRPNGKHGPCLPGSAFGGQPGLLASGTGGVSGLGGASGTAADTAECGSGGPTGGAPKVVGEPVAVAFDGAGAVVVQTREPAALFLADGMTIKLSTESRADTGHTVFHGNAGGFMACASCHPEGSDDGRVWTFTCEGRRRTQSLDVPIAGTEPLHWGGDMKSFTDIMNNVFMGRMSGPKLAPQQMDATFTWIERRPRAPASSPAVDPAAVERGRALFHNDPKLACASCHAGAKLTNNVTVDVGTGGPLQVPSLIGVGNRAPFMHDGCAKTLADRFNPTCGGGDRHGVTSSLTPAQIADLVAYMESL